jgi:hypothetical protein
LGRRRPCTASGWSAAGGPGRWGLASDDDGLAHDDAVDIVGGRGRAVIELVDGDDFAVEDFEAGFFGGSSTGRVSLAPPTATWPSVWISMQ